LNEAKWDKIRKEISKENNEISSEKRRPKDYLAVKWRVNKKITTRKKQASKVFSTKTQEHSPFSENNQAFYSTADFSFHLSTVSERKVHFKKKDPKFCCAGVN